MIFGLLMKRALNDILSEKEKAVSSTIDSSKVTQTPSSAAVSVGVVKLNSDAGFIALRSLLHDDKQK